VWGLAIGVAGGAALGTLAETNQGTWMAMLSAGWGGIGALIGAINGRDRSRTLVYESATP
jgi:hypothetical protein